MRISGTVRDADTRAPIEGVHVRLEVGDRQIAETNTDHTGEFSVEERSGPLAEVGVILKVSAEKVAYRKVEATRAIGRGHMIFELEMGSDGAPDWWKRIKAWLAGLPGWTWGAAAAAVLALVALPIAIKAIWEWDGWKRLKCDVEAYTELRDSPPAAQYDRAIACIDSAAASGDYAGMGLAAQYLLIPAADAGFAPAALRLGALYDPRPLTEGRKGQLTPPDPVLAAERYRDAKSLGDSTAESQLDALIHELEQSAQSNSSARSYLNSLRRRGFSTEAPPP